MTRVVQNLKISNTKSRLSGLLSIIAFYSYVVIVGVVFSIWDPFNWFDNWSERQILDGVYGISVRLPVWGSLDGDQKFFVVLGIFVILIGLPMLSWHLTKKGWRKTTASFTGCIIGVIILFMLLGISFLQYMVMSCLSDAWLHLAKIGLVGTFAAVPLLFIQMNDVD